MKQPDEFDTIFDECLESILSGESVETCLERYPDRAEELRPLLETALEARDAADVAPRTEFRQEASRQFQQALHDLPVRQAAPGFFSFRHWWVSAVAVLAIVIFTGAGTVLAANTAQPDNFFYSVKLATESFRIYVAGSDEAKAELYAEFAQRRVDEIIAMADKGDAAAVAKATEHLDGQLVAMAGVLGSESSETFKTMTSTGDQGALRAPAPTTTAATTTTTATTVPMAAATPPPASSPEPTTITVTPPPPATITFNQSPSGAAGDANLAAGWAEGSSLESSVAAQAAEASLKLQAALANAPEASRQGLEHALEVVTSGYGQVLSGLDH